MSLSQIRLKVLLRWINNSCASVEEVQRLLTVVALFSDSVELEEVLPTERKLEINEEFVQELFAVASPQEALTLLDTGFGRNLPAELYGRLYHTLLEGSLNDEDMARLMWAAGGFLDLHSGAFRLPQDIAERFIASSDFDERLGGFRAHRHSEASDSEVVEQLTVFLEHKDWGDKWTGLSGIQRIIDARGLQCFRAAGEETLAKLFHALNTIPDDDGEPSARSFAQNYHEFLREAI